MAEASTLSIELERRPTGSRLPSDPPIPLTPPNLQSDLQPELPDGGYGWVVVCGCAVLSFWCLGIAYSWGILQAALVKQGLSSASTLSFVGSSTIACVSGLAVINARVIRFLGARRTALLGISLLGAGEILSGFATENIGGMFVTFGAVTGIGTSLCFMVVSITPAQYFNKRRGLANGIVYASASGGFGGAVTSFAMDALLKSVGPAYTFRIIGLGLFSATPALLSFFIAGAIGTFPLFVPPFFLPLYSNSVGLSSSTGAGLVAGFNFSSALGRLGCGFASDLIGPVNVLFVALLFSAVSMLAIWPVSTSLTPLVIFVMINGVANGGFFSTMPTVVGTVFGSARVSVAMGMIVTGWAGGYLMVRKDFFQLSRVCRFDFVAQGAPIAGYLLNAYGGADSTLSAYHPAMFYAGSMGLGATGLVSLVRLQTSTRFFQKV
ncbi:Monocarboxylate permease Mch4 [Mycena sanguinolenta]|uniref:Monocarboxylate permease Mch4 n=1 Tax=Mycena sanguinolenta TaxID=230812 RepID=A0A8H7D0D3_9AGAR|nr:Monocarboxylate permease Mch4 [Mycena sanguinolenta]